MSNEIIVENVIASTNIDLEIDLEELHESLSDSQINYEKIIDEESELSEIVPLSVLWENNDGIALVLFNDGRLVSVQATTIKDATESIEEFIKMLENL